LVCELEAGIHTISIENCSSNGNFRLDNLIVEGRNDAKHPNYQDPESKQFTFIVSR
jgi:hypothetical protein